MQIKELIVILFSILIFLSGYSQGNYHCNVAEPFCTSIIYNEPMPIDSVAETGPDYGCLQSQQNPMWFFLLVDIPGNFIISLSTDPANDINFVVWGPFNNEYTPCTSQLTAECTFCPSNTTSPTFYPSGNLVDCSFDTSKTETVHINGALHGQYYLMMVSNFSNQPCHLLMRQINYGLQNAASTNCSVGCDYCIGFNSPNISFCNQTTNTYNVSGILTKSQGEIHYLDSLFIIDSPSGVSDTIYPPFSGTEFYYQLNNITDDGLTHKLSVIWSPYHWIGDTISYLSPQPCDNSNNPALYLNNSPQIYYNSETNQLYISNNSTNSILQLYNLDGKLIQQINLISKESEFQLNQLCPGMYILKTINQDKTHTTRLIKY